MSRSLTISAATGRVFPYRQQPDLTGHILTIDYTSSSTVQVNCTSAVVTPSGEIFTSDTRGNITQILLSQNRFAQHIRNIYPCSFIYNLGKEILCLVHDRELLIYNTSGKKLNELKNHYSAIKGIDFNHQRNLFLTYSSENAVIYEASTWKVIRNMRAKSTSYLKVIFSPDGNSIFNSFNDGKVYRWRLSDNKLEKQFAFCDVSVFCVSADQGYLFGANSRAEMFVWDMGDTSRVFKQFDAILGVTSVIQVEHTEHGVLILANNGRLFILNIDLSRIECELQLGVSYISSFSLNSSTNTLALTTNKGLLHIYDFSKWQKFNTDSRKEKVRKGLEEDLAYQYIRSFHPEAREIFEDDCSQNSLAESEDIVFTKLNRNPEKSSSKSDPNLSFQSKPNCQHELFNKLFGIAKLDPHSSKINHCKMKKILTVNGEYPEKFRPLIWRFMLQLPNNVDSFAGLYHRGTHPSLIRFFEKFKKTSQNEFSRTERITSALCYWSSLLSQVDYLHEIVGSFVMVYPGDDLSCFELGMSLILHWMQHWFEFFPSPPVVVIESVSNIIKFHRPGLFKYLSDKVNLDQLIWNILKNFLAKAVSRNDWLKLMDYLFTEWQNPEKLLYMVACYFFTMEKLLLKLEDTEIFKFCESGKKINVKKFFERVEETFLNHGAAVISFNLYLPVCQGQYPLFTAYPKYKVQSKEELAEEILNDMKEKEEIRRYNICLTDKVKSLEAREKDFIQRAKTLGLNNDDIIEKYHEEIVMKKSSLISVNNQ